MIDTHIIIGFPGEKESDLQDTLTFIKDVHFDKVWVYKFDRKNNTEAYTLPNALEDAEIDRRIHRTQDFFDTNGIFHTMHWKPEDSNADQYLNT
jgi:tRNA A37 methylthiotransferase MiaB